MVAPDGVPFRFDTAFASLGQLQAGGLIVAPDPFFSIQFRQLVALSSRHAISTISMPRQFAAAGGLISYGADEAPQFRQAGVHAGRILKGANPADLPVRQATVFKLVINLKTAKALGLTIPPAILTRADELIK
jgi:putative ABC transport system substrate-binding protein